MGILTREPAPPGYERQKPAAYSAVRTLTASAQRIQLSDPTEIDVIRKRRSADVWQDEAWEYYDAIGEVKYALTLVGNVTSRVRLLAATIVSEDEPPVSVEDAPSLPDGLAEISKLSLNRLGSAHGGIAGLLRDAAINIAVAGECYLMQTPENQALKTAERWDVRSVSELIVDSSGKMKLKTSRYTQQASYEEIAKNAFAGRIWRSHPRYSDEADSSMRSLRDLCLASGTYVHTATGAKPVEEIEVGDYVLSREGTSLVKKRVVRKLEQGVKPVFEVKTRRRTFKATGNHPVLVVRNTETRGKGHYGKYVTEWVRVDELKPGDHLVAMDSAPDYGSAQYLSDGTKIDEDIAWYLGIIIGDGCVRERGVRISDFDPVVRARLDEIVGSHWGIKNTPQGGTSRYSGRIVAKPLMDLGLDKFSYERTIPNVVWNSSDKVKRAFLDGYETSDGYRWKTGTTVHYGATSERLIREIRALHMALGHTVANVGKQQRDCELINFGCVTTKFARSLWGFDVYFSEKRNGKLWHRRSRQAAELLGEQFETTVISSVTPAGSEETWDLEVEGTHNFLADGIVVHNCDELLLLARTVRATARSRLNAGALFVPDGLTVSAVEEQDSQVMVDGEPIDTTVAEETDDFEDQLVEAMTMPIADEESASAVVPLLIRGPAELGDKIRPIKFERAFDAALAQRADKVIERIMQGIDVPKDIVTGLANVKYSNAIQIDESLYKAHIEPLVLLLCDALTAVFLRPALIAAGWSPQDARKVVVWYDPSEILTRPDRASDANDGYDRYAISHEAWRRHHGFPETDAPTNDEIAMRLMISRGALAPEVTQALLTMLVPDLMERARQIGIQNSPAPLSPHAQEVLNPGAGIPGPAPDAQPQPPSPGAPPHPGSPVPTPPGPVSTMPSPLPPEPVPAT